MKTLFLRILLPITLIFTMATCSPDPLDKESAVVPANVNNTGVKYNYSESESELARLINDYRISIGLNELELNDYVSTKAEEHNVYMIQNDDVSHAGFKERADDIIKILGAQKVSENIAYNFDSPESALNAWSNSPKHKANLEGDFTHYGISIKINPANEKKYFMVIFIKI